MIANKFSQISRLILIFFLLCSGCGNSNEVRTFDLAGTWLLDDSSRKYLPPGLEKSFTSILLNVDGGFQTSELPVSFLEGDEVSVGLFSGRGTWKLINNHQGHEIQLDLLTSKTGMLDIPLPFSKQLYISFEKEKLILFYYKGDPDNMERIEFRKMSLAR